MLTRNREYKLYCGILIFLYPHYYLELTDKEVHNWWNIQPPRITFHTAWDRLCLWIKTSSTTSSILVCGRWRVANSGVARNNGSHFFSRRASTNFWASRSIGLGGRSRRSLPQPPPASITCNHKTGCISKWWVHSEKWLPWLNNK